MRYHNNRTRKNEEISWWKAHINKQKLKLNVSMITYVFLGQKRVKSFTHIYSLLLNNSSPEKHPMSEPGSKPAVHGVMGCSQKRFKLVWRCHQLLSGFLAKSHLPWVSCQSRQSLMIRVIMKWSWWLCSDLLAFALQLRKTSARRPSDEGAMRPVIASNGENWT